MRKMDKVSIIVRTCGRPEVLRGALESIRKQTYPDVETVVIEDGLEISRQGKELDVQKLEIWV